MLVCIHVCTCKSSCVYICRHVCTYVGTCIQIHIHIHTHHAGPRLGVAVSRHVHTCMCAYIHTHTHTHVKQVRGWLWQLADTYTHACIYVCIVCMNTHTHTIQVRGRVWQLAIGNELCVTEELFHQRLQMVKLLIQSGAPSTGPDPRSARLKG
jgi:hypothetical protein